MQPTQIRHCAYARWTWGLNPYAVCDSDADPLQSGVQHDPVLIGGVDLAERFIAGQLRASDGLTLDIADVVGGSYRTQVATLEGTQCAVEIVSRITFDEHYVVAATTMARLRYAIPGRAGLGSVDAYTPRMTLLSQTFINDAALEAAEGISGAELDTMIEDLEGDLVKVLELEMRPGALPDGAVLDP